MDALALDLEFSVPFSFGLCFDGGGRGFGIVR